MYIAPIQFSSGLKVHNIKAEGTRIVCSLILRVGSLNDSVQGSAHYLEHTLLSFDKFRIQKDSEPIVRGKTTFDRTTYYIESDISRLSEALSMIAHIINGTYICDKYFMAVKEDILGEYILSYPRFHREKLFLQKISNTLCSALPVGSMKTIMNWPYPIFVTFLIEIISLTICF